MSGLIEELKRRNVFKVGAAYVVMAWLVAQITDVFLENFGAPDWVIKTILMLLIVGFPLALFFAWAFEMTPEGIKKEKDVDRSQSITAQTGRKLDYTIIAVLLLALGYFAYDKFVLESPRASAGAETAQAPSADAPSDSSIKSIAVLPFVNMSDDTSNEYFSDGISEEILNALAKVHELQVAGRTSSFAFKGENQDLRVIGEALGVNHILEGSVRKAGDKVRITAQLIQVDNGFHLWSESYDRELTDVFAIQDEIANAILVQLKAQLIGDQEQVVAATRTNSEAYDLYLLAKQRMYERSRLPLEAAADMLDKAIALDPEYAPAYAQRGIVTNLLSETQYGLAPYSQSKAQSKLYIDQALRLDPELAEGWAALGLYHYDEPGKLKQGIAELEKALALNPGLIDAANWLNNGYITDNQPAKALALLEDVMQRDPLYKPGLGNLVALYVMMGQPEKSKALIEKARPFLSQDANLAWADGFTVLMTGELAQALPLLEKAVQLSPEDRVFRRNMGQALLQTHQYERVAEIGYWREKTYALRHLDRVEEATLLVQGRAAEGELLDYFSLLNTTGQPELITRYLDERWADLEAFATDFPSNGYVGYNVMIEVALAYKKTGNQQRFDDAMSMIRAAHDSLISQGLNNRIFFTLEAAYYAMAEDRGKALEFLAAAVDNGLVVASRITEDLPFFQEFEGDPEYEAIQARMMEHVNRERAKLSLEPVST
jgi:TolB-like protein/Tfp pilus assembly protein PilF